MSDCAIAPRSSHVTCSLEDSDGEDGVEILEASRKIAFNQLWQHIGYEPLIVPELTSGMQLGNDNYVTAF